jgi:hypothetical protein
MGDGRLLDAGCACADPEVVEGGKRRQGVLDMRTEDIKHKLQWQVDDAKVPRVDMRYCTARTA